ncbi:DUF6631 family protein [Pseudomonas aeruginosa]|uniref:DUF6631 family protein n=1 Tax=Pseudomonas aeruginosa TaxID=287 RepID=UPI003D6DD8AC
MLAPLALAAIPPEQLDGPGQSTSSSTPWPGTLTRCATAPPSVAASPWAGWTRCRQMTAKPSTDLVDGEQRFFVRRLMAASPAGDGLGNPRPGAESSPISSAPATAAKP